MFLNTLDIKPGKTKLFAIRKMESTSGCICPNDNRANAIAIMEQHIRSFTSYISHYSSHTDKKYLSQDVNIAKIYKSYTKR